MPVITAISPQKNQKRVNIYLDGKFGFGLDLANFVMLGLKVNQELSEEKVAEIIKKAEYQKTLDYLLKFATLRPRSEKEINDWLKRKKVHLSLHPKLLQKLKDLDLLDDEKFAKWWVDQRQAFSPKAKRILNYELRIKGINKEIIDQVLESENVDEVAIAGNQLKKVMYRFEKYDKRLARQKMAQFLARKGFSWDIIKRVTKESDDSDHPDNVD